MPSLLPRLIKKQALSQLRRDASVQIEDEKERGDEVNVNTPERGQLRGARRDTKHPRTGCIKTVREAERDRQGICER